MPFNPLRNARLIIRTRLLPPIEVDFKQDAASGDKVNLPPKAIEKILQPDVAVQLGPNSAPLTVYAPYGEPADPGYGYIIGIPLGLVLTGFILGKLT